ncbi:MAG: hypothetical protein QM690_21660, partial [Sphingobium sp.]
VQYQKRNSSGFSRKQSQKRDTEPLLEPIPPSPPNGGDTPAGDLPVGSGDGDPKPADTSKTERGHRLPEDWTPPAVDDLPPTARNLVRQWPPGACQAVCEAFRLHWISETRAVGCKKNWTAALGKWLINEHGRIMRDAARGVSFAPAAPIMARKPPRKFKPVPSAALEDQRSAMLRTALDKALGEDVMAEWFASSALLVNAPLLTVISRSDFHRQWCEQHYGPAIAAVAAKVSKGAVISVRWTVETPKSAKDGEKNGSGN